MSFARKLMQAYFNFAYNPVYDFTTGRLNRYQQLQRTCVGKLELRDNDKVLCVGIGTGNEICHILEMNRNVNIVGVDYSRAALQKACKKALTLGREIEVFVMDARHLDFPTGSFDKVLCLHVMDFVEGNRQLTGEIVRVLNDRGQFVITYPSHREAVKLALNLLKDSFRHNIDSGKHHIRAFSELLAQMMIGIMCLPAYLPLLLCPKDRLYLHSELEAMITQLTTGGFQIEEDPVYQDFIVYGRKIN